ncbi:membrane protein [Arthrobacter phage Atuin]|nr:membrane protein [Arthrobacter phage Atuin]
MLFWGIILVIVLVATVAFFAEGKGEDGAVAAVGSALCVAVLGLIVSGIAHGVASSHQGTAVPGETKTYKIAEKSDLTTDNGYLEFTYEDDKGTLQHFDEDVDEVRYIGGKREVVEIHSTNYTVHNLFPWDIHSTEQKAVVK